MPDANLQFILSAAAIGLAAGAAFWLLATLANALSGRLPRPSPFPGERLAAAGSASLLRTRAMSRRIAILLAAMLCAFIAAGVAWLLVARLPLEGMLAWSLVALSCLALVAVAAWQVVRLYRARREARLEWAAKGAVGSVLGRLNFSGHRVFSDVAIEGASIDHVVLGGRGVFAVNVLARPLPKGAAESAGAELRNGKLKILDRVETLAVGEAARNMTLLSNALSRVVGHRVPVRSVIAVPGWNTRPNDTDNHLLLNERNLVTLTSWNRPDAYLMDEDCLSIQAFLIEASADRTA